MKGFNDRELRFAIGPHLKVKNIIGHHLPVCPTTVLSHAIILCYAKLEIYIDATNADYCLHL